MNSQHIPTAIGVSGLLGTVTLGDINTVVAIAVGFTTLMYLLIKIVKELKDGKN